MAGEAEVILKWRKYWSECQSDLSRNPLSHQLCDLALIIFCFSEPWFPCFKHWKDLFWRFNETLAQGPIYIKKCLNHSLKNKEPFVICHAYRNKKTQRIQEIYNKLLSRSSFPQNLPFPCCSLSQVVTPFQAVTFSQHLHPHPLLATSFCPNNQ